MSFYAVAVGRKIGIYNNWYVGKNTHLKSMKSFPLCECKFVLKRLYILEYVLNTTLRVM